MGLAVMVQVCLNGDVPEEAQEGGFRRAPHHRDCLLWVTQKRFRCGPAFLRKALSRYALPIRRNLRR
jgi:hypothetical protein